MEYFRQFPIIALSAFLLGWHWNGTRLNSLHTLADFLSYDIYRRLIGSYIFQRPEMHRIHHQRENTLRISPIFLCGHALWNLRQSSNLSSLCGFRIPVRWSLRICAHAHVKRTSSIESNDPPRKTLVVYAVLVSLVSQRRLGFFRCASGRSWFITNASPLL